MSKVRLTRTESVEEHERRKYLTAWNEAPPSGASHGLTLWNDARELFPSEIRSATDFGCGRGRLVKAWRNAGINGYGFDIAAPHCLDADVRPSIERYVAAAPLWRARHDPVDVAVCTDVLEHIPGEHVEASLEVLREAAPFRVLWISHEPGNYYSRATGEDFVLHLSPHSREWWIDKIREIGGVVELADYEVSKRKSVFVWRD